MSALSRESPLIRLAGIVMKLFRLRSKLSNEDRELRSMGNALSNRLQSLKFNFVKEDKPDKRGSRNGSSVGDERKD